MAHEAREMFSVCLSFNFAQGVRPIKMLYNINFIAFGKFWL